MKEPEPTEDFRIDFEGRWYHRGERIEKDALVRFFAERNLCFEDGAYWLKTEEERHRVAVEDVPFLIVDYAVDNPGTPGQAVHLTTNLGARFTLGPDHPLIVEGGPGKGVVLFYAMVHDGLKARCNRAVNHDFVARLLEERDGDLVIRSSGAVFTVSALDF